MRRIISRTRSSRPGRRTRSRRVSRYDSDFDDDRRRYRREPEDRDSYDNNRSQKKSGKKTSPVTAIVIIAVLGAIIGGIWWYSSKSDEGTRKAGPEAVIKQVIAAIGTNSLTKAKGYVQDGDTATTTQLEELFDAYDTYFTYDEDYINWTGMSYTLSNNSDTTAQIDVSGTAEIVEVSFEEWEDFDGEFVEDRTEEVIAEYSFSGVTFGLKKVGEEWFLDNIPSTIF